ncbi:ABC transporter permease [Jatrophihabitans endophyticus]|uniref:ABC transporter permease n=1 Tax=Jatrophihabitans endophyticus TaxID=1206085 RepID=UPI001A0B0B41|nr:ABC transporter permease [Jatrophihabitans endophyticus]MBE7188758.1 ABC transporter permease [Jatrophihabitans endophyticus]
MTTVTATDRPSPGRAFVAVLWRDLWVTGRELPVFLAQVLLQPLFLLFVFGKVLSEIGATSGGYSTLLFPGIVALTTVLTSLQGTALPLVLDFSFSREIEDRLLAPLPLMLVAVEKMVFASMRSIVAAAVMFPLGYWILGSLTIRASGVPLLVVAIVVGALLGSAIGMTLGTFVPPTRINIMFALILTPLIFTGCTQYPWPSLSHLRWFQVITLFNPLTYASETIRGAVVPHVAHMDLAIALPVLLAATVLFVVLGMIGFRRRAVD